MIFKQAGAVPAVRTEIRHYNTRGLPETLPRRKLNPGAVGAEKTGSNQRLVPLLVGEGRSSGSQMRNFATVLISCCEFREQLYYHQGIRRNKTVYKKHGRV